MSRRRRSAVSASRRNLAVRPNLEGLEDRRLLAAFTVTSGTDDGVGSLRAEIALADASPGADTINFQAGLNAVTLTSGRLTLNSDLTITGGLAGVTIARSARRARPSSASSRSSRARPRRWIT